MTRPIAVRTLTSAEHLAFLDKRGSASFLQTPAWAQVKSEWRSESVGWYDGEDLVGAGLVLYRQLPKVKRYLAYLPEGPVLDWRRPDLAELLDALAQHVQTKGAFAVRIGPPVVTRSWQAATIKAAIADPQQRRLADVPPDARHDLGAHVQQTLRSRGWRLLASEGGFAAGQPQYVFQIPLAGCAEEDLLRDMNQLWRRNIKKAAKLGVEVSAGDVDAVAEFHRIYVETAERDGFTPRPLSYFETMYSALSAEDPDRIRVYLAHHEGDLVAATLWIRVGTHTWYSYGASTTHKREVRGSNAVQWRMIQDALAVGASTYDLRGITDTLDEDDPHIGLIQFKVGTGGEAVEYVGEWDLPIPGLVTGLMYRAFDLYLRRR
ncbi:MAG: peptidoglycan bridge formation glycyltransferase FemA/FemB family protein [Propionibacteriales bacterium]|nr:peptidoglycan bridge formation glycyltransferase FemA/FemB family protein [Propionibacteriales bacterium]